MGHGRGEHEHSHTKSKSRRRLRTETGLAILEQRATGGTKLVEGGCVGDRQGRTRGAGFSTEEHSSDLVPSLEGHTRGSDSSLLRPKNVHRTLPLKAILALVWG